MNSREESEKVENVKTFIEKTTLKFSAVIGLLSVFLVAVIHDNATIDMLQLIFIFFAFFAMHQISSKIIISRVQQKEIEEGLRVTNWVD